jgi:hypothetical protein
MQHPIDRCLSVSTGKFDNSLAAKKLHVLACSFVNDEHRTHLESQFRFSGIDAELMPLPDWLRLSKGSQNANTAMEYPSRQMQGAFGGYFSDGILRHVV